MDKMIRMDSVDVYNNLYGLETLHPLVAVVDLAKAKNIVNHVQINYGVYALYLKGRKSCDIKYGRQTYDYQEGTIVCFAPGQVVQVGNVENEVQPEVYGLLFHPDLIRGTALGQHMEKYRFFSYAVNEALHLSEDERQTVMNSLYEINVELERPLDKHSTELLCMNIELLLSHCLRFYERQFITRSQVNKDILIRFEQLLGDYFLRKLPETEGLPTVKYFADKICLSPNYFGDLIKKETGMPAIEYIQSKLIEVAKEKIVSTNDTMSQIAYELGFQYPQHFGRLFKQKSGCTPNEYRSQHA